MFRLSSYIEINRVFPILGLAKIAYWSPYWYCFVTAIALSPILRLLSVLMTEFRSEMNNLWFSWFTNTVDSCYLEVQGTLWNTSRYPYLTYQICRIGEMVNGTTRFHKWICNLTFDCRNILKNIMEKRRFLLFSTIFWYLLLDFHIENRDQIFISR